VLHISGASDEDVEGSWVVQTLLICMMPHRTFVTCPLRLQSIQGGVTNSLQNKTTFDQDEVL
jgi:hypothetical protein